MATYSGIFVGKISWAEEPCGQQFTGLQRVRHDLVTELVCRLDAVIVQSLSRV